MKLEEVKDVDKLIKAKHEMLKVIKKTKENIEETENEELKNIIENLERITTRDIEEMLKKKEEVIININQVEGTKEKIYLYEKLINGKANKEIATIMSCSVRNVQLIGSKAIKSLLNNIDKK